jgi:hypothetical protein
MPPLPKKEKKKKVKKKRTKAKIVIPVFVLLILAILSFLIFGGEKVPEQIRNIKGYSYMTGIVKEKLPEKLPFELPFDLPKPPDVSIKLPFDISFKLPFDLPDPGNLFGGGNLPDKKKITKDLTAYKGEKGSKIEFDSLKIEKRTTAEKKKQDTVYVVTTKKGEDSAGYYKLVYKRQLIGGWKLKDVKPYNEQKTAVSDTAAADADAGSKNAADAAASKKNVTDSGVKDKAVLSDPAVLSDIPSDWKQSNLKVVDHYTDLKAGTDTVVLFMELENSYVNMTGTKEVTYKYNEKTKKWEAVSVSKLTCQTIEPITPAEEAQ